MKYFLIAGEVSGDQHAAKLMQSIRLKDPEADFAFLGGDNMENQGGKAIVHIREMAFMGFTQILLKLLQIQRNFRAAKSGLIVFDPDILILIDYAGFNLRMAKWAHREGYKVYYYIAPKVWAWRAKRVIKIRKYVDHVLAILPFEVDFFEKQHVQCTYVGNPVLEDIQNIEQQDCEARKKNKVIALLPGSRTQEIRRVLPIMLAVAVRFPDYHFVIAGMSAHKELYTRYMDDVENIDVIFNETRNLGKFIVLLLLT